MKWKGEDELVLWLVRNGESTWNILGLVQGQTDEPTLTRQGRRQAQKLAELFQDLSVAAVYASDLGRAKETANVLGAALGLQVRPCRALRERSFVVYENRPLISLCPAVTGIQAERVVDIFARPEGGESLDDVYACAGHVHRVAPLPTSLGGRCRRGPWWQCAGDPCLLCRSLPE